MASNGTYLGEGSNINRPPSFNGEYYDFWKIRMKIFIESQDLKIWDAIENGPFIPCHNVDGINQPKPRSSWNNEDKKEVQYDLKAKNILTSALGMDEFFRISNCKSAKEMWDTLETTHEGTNEVKRSRLNTLSQEYELFRMLPGERILGLQKRFTHLTNHLIALGKVFTNTDLNLKVLRSLTRAWQPKVTAISEKKSLSKMNLATLFGKLQEHELELDKLEQLEGREENQRSIALKAKYQINKGSHDDNSNDEDDGDMTTLAKKFDKLLQKYKEMKSKQGKRFVMKNSKRPRKAYIKVEESSSSTSDSDSEEDGHIALMASHQSYDDYDEVSSSFENPSYDELQDAFNELHDEFMKLSKICSIQKKTILSLESKINSQVANSQCDKCIHSEAKIIELHKVITNFEKSTKNLDNVLNVQRPLHDKRGLGFSSHNKMINTKKIIFVRQNHVTRNHGNGTQSKHVPKHHEHKSSSVYISSHTPKRNISMIKTTCFYCNNHGHTPNTCYIRNVGVPIGTFIWVEKGTNINGPKIVWVPKCKK